jgi:small subunit ribosomal protein S20
VANIKSQIKRNLQNNKRRLRNRAVRGTARIAARNAHAAIESGTPETKAALMEAISQLDRAAEKGVIHKNNAARRKSRLMKAYAKMEPVQAEAAPVEVAEPVAEPEPKPAPRRSRAKAAAAAPEEKKKPARRTAAKKAAE